MEKQNQVEPQKQEGLKIKLYDVHSNKVKKVGWYFCPTSFQGVFIAEFANNVRYMYFPIAKEVYDGIFKSPSKGSYFTTEVEKRPGVTYQKIGQPKMDL